MKNYQRVLPRDLFNESKLLEQIGRICLAIHDGKLTQLDFEHDGEAFDIQLSDEGGLYISNLEFLDSKNSPIFFSTNYNSRQKNPLMVLDPETEENLFVFGDSGEFSKHFLEKFA
jgi:hypothetical protein